MLLACAPLLIHCNESSKESADKDSDKPQAESEEATSDEESEEPAADVPGDDLYPGFNFGSFDDDQKVEFVEVTKAEICPCPDSTESLHQCLQDESARCALAMQAAVVAGESVRQGLNQTDTLNRIAELVEVAKTKHEFDLENEPHKGPVDAPVTLVEFADFTCPHCKGAAEVLDEIAEKYGDKVVVYFKSFPLSSHDDAIMAASAALAAHQQGKFWAMHDQLFKYQTSLTQEKVDRFARQLGMNYSKFKQQMNSQAIQQEVNKDKQEGIKAGVNSTPTLFINGRRYLGAKTVEGISARIEQELAAQEDGESGESSEADDKGASKEAAEDAQKSAEK
jgi:protein-disulfide isomerase